MGRRDHHQPEVDAATRNVRVRATFENQDGRLRPGMFGKVQVLSSGTRPVLVIPATAVIFAPYGDSVFAIEQKKNGPGRPSPSRPEVRPDGESGEGRRRRDERARARRDGREQRRVQLRNGVAVRREQRACARRAARPGRPTTEAPGGHPRLPTSSSDAPVIAIVVSLVIVIAGLQAIRSLNARQYPRSENAQIIVTTTYVGANSELVRGFITTPLERVIASAGRRRLHRVGEQAERLDDQGPPAPQPRRDKALSEIGAKVDQVRGDLPPEAEVPVITIETADSELASAYLSFLLKALKQNEITDYLVRVVQPRLSAIEGVHARTSSARGPSRCGSGSSPTAWRP